MRNDCQHFRLSSDGGVDKGPVQHRLPLDGCASPSCAVGDRPEDSNEPALSLARLTLVLAVTTDEEYVRLRILGDRMDLDLGERAHHFLVLALARRRLADARDGCPDAACGWVYVEDWEHDPSLSPPRLNLGVFRIRQQLWLHGVTDARQVIERRRSTRQIRLGTDRVTIAVV